MIYSGEKLGKGMTFNHHSLPWYVRSINLKTAYTIPFVMERETISQIYCPKSIGMLLTIVGTRHYTPAEKLGDYLKEVPNHKMMLMAEPYNKEDPDAVAVFDIDRACIVGYIRWEDLPKVHRLMTLHSGTTILLHVVGLVPRHHTSLMAYPVVDGMEITDLSGPEAARFINSTDVFGCLVRSLPSIHPNVKKVIYDCFRYLRDRIGINIPQHMLSAFCRSIEYDKCNNNSTTKIDQLIAQNTGKVTHE